MTTINISTTAQLIAAIGTGPGSAQNGDILVFAAGDYTSVAIDISDNRDLTFTSANAGIDSSVWAGNVASEVILNRITSNGSVVVNGIHVHQTVVSANFADGNWEAIATATAGETLDVRYSLVTIDATSDLTPGQAFGVVATYDTQSITVDHVNFGPYLGNFDPTFANYGVYVNGSDDPSHTVTITNNDFDLDTTRNVGVKLAGQVSGLQVVITGNEFEDPGTAQGAIRIDDEGAYSGPQDFSGITGNHFTGTATQISNETGDTLINNGSDTVVGTAGPDTFLADGGNDHIDGLGGIDTIDMANAGTGGAVVDLQLGPDGIAVSAATGLDTLVSIENAKGSAGADYLAGNDVGNDLAGRGGNDFLYGRGGADHLDGGAGVDAMDGGDGNDTYVVDNTGDTTIEGAGVNSGTDTVLSSVSITLADNVENLTLTDVASQTETFEAGFGGAAAITNGEHGWQVSGVSVPVIAVDPSNASNHVLKISSNPTDGSFGGPYSPDIGVSAGEPQTTADGDVQIISFRVKPVDVLGDNSRIELDFGNQNGTDRNSFMVIESTAGGVRVAVADSLPGGDFDTGGDINDFSAFTGNRTLISGVSGSDWLNLELRVHYADGANNDTIDVYLNGTWIGQTNTFENYRDAIDPDHAANAEANQTSRILIRASAGPAGAQAPQGDPAQNKGFFFDDMKSTVTHSDAADGGGIDGAGNALNNIIIGNSDANVLTGNGGDDTLTGGGGIDTAAYGGVIEINAKTDISYNAGDNTWVVNAHADGTDTLSGMEVIDDATGGRTLLVGAGGFATIQAAINAAADGDTIIVAPGTYDEDLNINKAVTILGAHHGDAGTGGTRNAASGAGETTIIGHAHITALGAVTIDGVRFLNDATTTGGGPSNPSLFIGTGYDHVITNSIFYSTVQGGARPPAVPGGADDRAIMLPGLNGGHITISDNLISGSEHGLFATASWGRGIWSDGGNGVVVDVTGNTIEFSRTGINADMGGTSALHVDHNTFHSDGTAIAVGVDTDGLTVTHNTVENVGDEFNFRNLTTSVDFDAQAAIDTLHPASPADLVNDAVVILGGGGADTLKGTAGVDVIIGNDISASATDADIIEGRGGNDFLYGRGGNDTITGGAGDDTIDGGAGKDTAIVAGTATITKTVTGWQVVSTDGTDTLTGVEIVQSAGGNVLLVGTGGFATIQEAINAASNGDTIMVAAGTYDEDLNINKAVTILGAHSGDAVGGRNAGSDVGETNIIGHANITALGAVTVDGVRFINDGTTTGGGSSNPTLNIGTGFDHVITNSIFYSTVAGGAPGVDDRAIMLPGLGDGDITISNNLITGSHTGLFNDASWGRGIWSDGGGTTLHVNVTGNTIEFSRTAINADMSGTSTFNVDHNTFHSDGSGISVGFDTDGLTITHNTVENVGDEFNFRNLTTGVTFDAQAAIDTLHPASPVNLANDAVFILGGAGADTLKGTAGVDVITGNDISASATDADIIEGRGGNDSLYGRGGNDTIDGGADNDTIDGGDGNDTVTGGTGNDTLEGGAGTDTAVFEHNIGEYVINLGPGDTYAVSRNGETDFVHGFENFNFNGVVVDVAGNPGGLFNTHNPLFISAPPANVDENVSTAFVVYDANATDADAAFDDIVYSLSGTDATSFNIDAATGKVTFVASPDRETKTSYDFDVVATQGTTSNSQHVALGINDLNDNNPVISTTPPANVDENISTATVVYNVDATDADLTLGAIVYSLSGTDAGAFNINAGTGEVTFVASPDRETKSSYSFDVVATQGASTSSQHVALGINDLNDNLPVFQSLGTANVDENKAATTIVYNADATDADLTLGAIVYSLSGADATLLNINASTGEVRLNAPANFEAKDHYLFNVVAAQGATSTAKAVDLAINNFNEVGPSPLAVQMEAGSTQAPLHFDPVVDPDGAVTYKVTTLPVEGTLFLNGVAVTVNQVLSQANYDALTFSSPETSGTRQVTFDVVDPLSNHTIVTNDIQVLPAKDDTYTDDGSHRIDGAGGNDVLVGTGASVTMLGGTGNDIFIVDNNGDTTIEQFGQGTDLVYSSVSFVLAANIENLTQYGTLGIAAIGNALNNSIVGNAGANVLYGLDGNDTLTGNAGADRLFGGNGDDKLLGGIGNDILVGGAGKDNFVFNVAPTAANRDVIGDFSHNDDTFQLENAIFTKLGGAGHLNADFFRAGTAAVDGDDYLIYNHTNGQLFYDSNANVAGGMQLIAILQNKPILAANDFDVI